MTLTNTQVIERMANDAAIDFQRLAALAGAELSALPVNDDMHAASDAVQTMRLVLVAYDRMVALSAVIDGPDIERCAYCNSRYTVHYVNPPDMYLCATCCGGGTLCDHGPVRELASRYQTAGAL